MKIGIFANIQKKHVREVLCSLLNWITKRNIEIIMGKELFDWLQYEDSTVTVVPQHEL